MSADHIILARPVRSGEWLARTAVRDGVPGIEFRSPTLGRQKSGRVGILRPGEANGWAPLEWIRSHSIEDPVGVEACDSAQRARYRLELRELVARLERGAPAARIRPNP